MMQLRHTQLLRVRERESQPTWHQRIGSTCWLHALAWEQPQRERGSEQRWNNGRREVKELIGETAEWRSRKEFPHWSLRGRRVLLDLRVATNRDECRRQRHGMQEKHQQQCCKNTE